MADTDDTIAETYKTSWISNFFHSFPHLNVKFERVKSRFEPGDRDYIESLIFWALVPVALCLLLWLFYLIYFICRCCSQQEPGRRYSLCPRLTTGFGVFLVIGLLAFGLFENEAAHRGVSTFRTNLIEINKTIGEATDKINGLDVMVDDINGRLFDSIIKAVQLLKNSTLENRVEEMAEKIKKETNAAHRQIDKLDLTDEFDAMDEVISVSDHAEYYRWLGTIFIHCLFICIIFFTLTACLVRSRAVLMVSTTVCVFSSLLLWALTGTHLGSTVALGDLCTDPNYYVIHLADNTEEQGVLQAYVECKNSSEPYGKEIQSAITSVNQALVMFHNVDKLVKPFAIKELEQPMAELNMDLQYSSNNLSILLDSVAFCKTLHGYYEKCLHGACVQTITATAWLTLTSIVVGLLSVIVILSNSKLWRQFSKARKYPVNDGQIDDTDPFLPRPPPYDSDYGAVGFSSPTPWSERGTLQQNRLDTPHSDDSLMMLPPPTRLSAPLPPDESPPPAYHPGRFVRQYADSSNDFS